ncbi:YvrJ family protein [Priestia aryabhattai]|nr:YvrJ family protein [Priestia aryabhattai]MDT0150293.1 YvrJ family protein [Priestia aryabhattai]MDT0155888.1 YvrJ family protein [Priestia aryabhattai]
MDGAVMDEVIRQVGNMGFPALLAIYLLTRFEKKLDELMEIIKSLSEID